MDESENSAQVDVSAAMDMPEMAGKCAFLGGYVEDGETVCYFGREYLCEAPRLVPTGQSC